MTDINKMIEQMKTTETKIVEKEFELMELKCQDAMLEREFRASVISSSPKEPSEAKLSSEYSVSAGHLAVAAKVNVATRELRLLQVENNYLQRLLGVAMLPKG